MAIKTLKAGPSQPTVASLPAGMTANALMAQQMQMTQMPAMPAPQPYVLPASTPGVREQVIAGVERDPEGAARVLKSWMAEK
jgi:hypothetical protein